MAETPVGKVLLCSSLSCFVGGLSYGAHAAGHRHMDAVALHERLAVRRSNAEWITVNYDTWHVPSREKTIGAGGADWAIEPAEGAAVLRLPPLPAPASTRFRRCRSPTGRALRHCVVAPRTAFAAGRGCTVGSRAGTGARPGCGGGAGRRRSGRHGCRLLQGRARRGHGRPQDNFFELGGDR
ncbi:MAG: hypothetical protein HPM95_15915 [Alphaproteobacteria bacterium]|nr:hypothetical protein [Alphaproteobacteria bacterium]